MNYRELKKFLNSLNETQLDMTATIYNTYDDEFIPLFSAYSMEDSDVIDCSDAPHPVLELKG